MAGLLLITLSVSPIFRMAVSRSVMTVRFLWILICAFTFIQFITIPFSETPGASLQLNVSYLVNWMGIFVISCVLFRRGEYVERYMALLCLLAIPVILIEFQETREQHVLWVNNIPKILQVPDPSVKLILTPNYRPGINLYRANSTFSSPLLLAEYLALLTPFLLHFGFYARKILWRLAAFGMIPVIFVAIRLTDSRLGIVGMLISMLLYGMLWSIVRWRSHAKDLFAAATVYGYPAVFISALLVVFSSHRLRTMVMGGDAQASSSAARDDQLHMAMTQLAKNPIGHGTGQSGLALGFPPGAFITVDNYFINLAMDYGVLGVIVWSGMILVAILEAVRCCLSPAYAGRPEARLLAALAVGLAAFMVIKWVHGQADNHSIIYMMLGMISALVYNLRNSENPASGMARQNGYVVREPTTTDS
jgi:hypothetical protein